MDPLVVNQIHWYHIVSLFAAILTLFSGLLAARKKQSRLALFMVEKILPISTCITIIGVAYITLTLLIK